MNSLNEFNLFSSSFKVLEIIISNLKDDAILNDFVNDDEFYRFFKINDFLFIKNAELTYRFTNLFRCLVLKITKDFDTKFLINLLTI